MSFGNHQRGNSSQLEYSIRGGTQDGISVPPRNSAAHRTHLWEENLRLSFAVRKATPLPNSSIDAGSGTSSNWKVAVEKKNMGLPIESSPLKLRSAVAVPLPTKSTVKMTGLIRQLPFGHPFNVALKVNGTVIVTFVMTDGTMN